MGQRRLRILYVGLVQGVGFRATARSVAQTLPVTGFVRNLADGSVEAQVQGESEALERFRAELARRMARGIRHEQMAELPPVTGETGFEIRR